MDNAPATHPSQPSIEEISLHPHADDLAKTLASDYASLLVIQGKVIAVQQKADQVQRVHIEDARKLLGRSSHGSWWLELCLFIGGGLFGAFIQGFIEALADGKKALVVVYVIIGFIGVTLFFWTFHRR